MTVEDEGGGGGGGGGGGEGNKGNGHGPLLDGVERVFEAIDAGSDSVNMQRDKKEE